MSESPRVTSETRSVSGVTGEGIDPTAKVTTETARDKDLAREALLETHRAMPETEPVTSVT